MTPADYVATLVPPVRMPDYNQRAAVLGKLGESLLAL